MSLPITAVGPLKVETKPILMVSPATAGPASARAVAPASQNAVLILVFPSSLTQTVAPAGQPPRSGEVFCARNQQAAASMNRRLPLEPSAHAQAACTIVRYWRRWQEL